MKKLLFRIVLVALLAGGGYTGYQALKAMTAQRALQIATTKVQQGDVVVRSFARGELRAVRSVTLTAPNLFGTVQVTQLASLGAFAREKDLVVEFDDSEVLSRLEEKQLELDQIDEQIKKAQADLAIRGNQDQVELLRARYAVRRAELEVRKNEIISAIDAKKNQLTLDETKRRLSQLESDVKSRQEQAQAEMAVLQERKNKAALEMAREKARLNQVKLLAPMSGLVAIKQNRSSVMMFGQQLPDIREGDQVQPGTPVADILDLSEMEVIAKVGELDRANLREGQEVNLRLDAIAERRFTGRIKSMSGTASANMFSGDVQKKFDVIFSVDMKELLTALGAKPQQIATVLATAEANRKKPPVTAAFGGGMMMAGGGPGGPGGGMMMTMGGGPPAQAAPAAGAPARSGGPGGGAGGARRGGTMTPQMLEAMMNAGNRFTPAEMERAKLPPPPGEDSQFEALLRPGLLADVEIIIEKIPNAIHIPNQALFEKDGKPIVYLQRGGKFDERPIRVGKRSESVVTIAEGLKPGDVIALTNPTEKPGSKKKGAEKQGAASGPPLPKS